MTVSTIGPLLLATPFAASLLELSVELLPLLAKIGRLIDRGQSQAEDMTVLVIKRRK